MKFIFLTIAILAAAKKTHADPPLGSPDPIFANIPFDQWSEKNPGARFRWTSQISKPALNQHQRLLIGIKIQVDGSELIKHQGQGQMLLLVQLRDSAGRIYQHHNALSLEDVNPGAGRTLSEYSQDAFVTPGDYQVSLGLFVTKTGEHAIARRPLHVDGLPHDPLGDAWLDLPPVEFLPEETPPDSWYLPALTSRLNLRIETKRAVSIELLVNGSSTEELPQVRILRSEHISLGEMIPAVKALSQISLNNGSSRIVLLDLERRRVSFEQTLERSLDWGRLKAALTGADPNKIDVASLENHGQNAQFFMTELQRRSLGSQVLILLSAPMMFDKADITPLQALSNPNCKVFYIRFHPMTRSSSRLSPPVFGSADDITRRPGRPRVRPIDSGFAASDELFALTKPLHPRLFDVSSPEDVRKALAAIVSEITRLANE